MFAVLALKPPIRDGRSGRASVIGVVRCTPGAVLERYSTPIDADGAAQAVREKLVDAAPVGHDVAATLDQLRSIGIRATRPSLDTRAVAEMLDPAARSYALADLCERYRLRHEAASGALGQAEAARMLLIALRRPMELDWIRRCSGSLPRLIMGWASSRRCASSSTRDAWRSGPRAAAHSRAAAAPFKSRSS